MRLWHYELIPVLPDEMLVAQWRELVAIKRQWEKGTLKHRLVSYITNYDKRIFMWYVNRVTGEMIVRNINYSVKLYLELKEFCNIENNHWTTDNYPEHNHRYLCQCYYNLQEKYDRGIISEDEFAKIEDFIREVTRNG